MGIALLDKSTGTLVFQVNFWHWRSIVEAIRSLRVLPNDRVAALHEPLVGELTQDEAQTVATAIRERLLPTLRDHERLLLDGQKTTEPDDLEFHREPAEDYKNYSTNRQVLEDFVECCEASHGFRVS